VDALISMRVVEQLLIDITAGRSRRVNGAGWLTGLTVDRSAR
jgi:hypothetical protein